MLLPAALVEINSILTSVKLKLNKYHSFNEIGILTNLLLNHFCTTLQSQSIPVKSIAR